MDLDLGYQIWTQYSRCSLTDDEIMFRTLVVLPDVLPDDVLIQKVYDERIVYVQKRFKNVIQRAAKLIQAGQCEYYKRDKLGRLQFTDPYSLNPAKSR